MEEPSVLDYVLEKLTFWRKGSLVIPPAEQGPELDKPTQPRSEHERGSWKKYLVFSANTICDHCPDIWRARKPFLGLGDILLCGSRDRIAAADHI